VAFLVLAIYCRAENNRTYLKKGVRLRPGYLAKWIEFVIEEEKTESKSKAKKVRDRAHLKLQNMSDESEEEQHV